jgi:hypothetical protein
VRGAVQAFLIAALLGGCGGKASETNAASATEDGGGSDASTCSVCPCVDGTVQILDGATHVCGGGCYRPIGDAGATCDYQGRAHPPGITFAAGDGCNTCSCGDRGLLACTHRSCLCDPKAEQLQRTYECTSPSECASIRFSCPENTTAFQNACGGGCEQSPSCPECESGQLACDEPRFMRVCPYSCIPLWN